MRKLAFAFLAGLLFAAPLAIGQTVLGLVAGPVGVGYPILITVAGTAANPSQTSNLDLTTGEFYPAAGIMSITAGGAEVGRANSNGLFEKHTVTNITTAGAGTLTAASMVGGVINRTGPGAGFTDTTDTASAIDTLLGTPPVGMAFDFEYANGVAFAATLAGGTGVTIVGSTGVVASGSRLVRCVKTAATPTYSCG
jgi:hypothetical protein